MQLLVPFRSFVHAAASDRFPRFFRNVLATASFTKGSWPASAVQREAQILAVQSFKDDPFQQLNQSQDQQVVHRAALLLAS